MEVEIEESHTLLQDQVDVARNHVGVVAEVEGLRSVVVVDAQPDEVVLERLVLTECLVGNLELGRLDEVAGGGDDHMALQNEVGVVPEPVEQLLVALLLVQVLEDVHDSLLGLEAGVDVI